MDFMTSLGESAVKTYVGGHIVEASVIEPALLKLKQYNIEHDKHTQELQKQQQEFNMQLSHENMAFQQYQAEEKRKFDHQIAEENNRVIQQMAAAKLASDERMNALNARTQEDIAQSQMEFASQQAGIQRDFETGLAERKMNFQDALEQRKMNVQLNIWKQQKELAKFLGEQKLASAQETAKFNALAMRETQILVSRENAQNMLRDNLVQEALKDFPLNISPLVLLSNHQSSLGKLLKFSNQGRDDMPDIASVYTDVMNYCERPEALNVFVAPIHLDASIRNREVLSEQIWDAVYSNLESLFNEYYSRQGARPVVFYPSAWKDSKSSGTHASETLHFFLEDIPCIVIEPRFDGTTFKMMFSAWNLGYQSSDHVRSDINFSINLDAIVAKAVYDRSVKGLELLAKLKDTAPFAGTKADLEYNVKLYRELDMDRRIAENDMDGIESLGIGNVLHVDPQHDIKPVADMLAAFIAMNLATLADVHHLLSTDVPPAYPGIMKEHYPELFADKNLRQLVYESYEKVYIVLRNDNTANLTPEQKNEMQHLREMQMTNLKKELQLIDENDIKETIDTKIRRFAKDKYNYENKDENEVWNYCIDRMTVDDIGFFEELLPNIKNFRLYKLIDKRINIEKRK
jgi:hypothetical protein